MTLAKEAGVDKKAAKAALLEHNDDYDAALAKLRADAPGADEGGASSAAAALEELAVSQNCHVSIVRKELGDGETYPAYGDTLFVEYTGTLDDGAEFDSSFNPARGKHTPFTFRVGMGKVIRGWDEAFMKMSVGERSLIFVPPAMGYGAAGAPPKVPPNATLKFDVTLLSITRQVSCVGGGSGHGGAQRKTHEYNAVAKQLLGQAPPAELDLKMPDEREPMPLTSEMPR